MGAWLLSIGRSMPGTRSTTEAAIAAGQDVSAFKGWPRYCAGTDDDQPSVLGATALRDALARAGLEPGALDLVLSTGTTRDYLGSWSLANELVGAVGARCIGIDIMLGCLGLLAGIDLARGWLADPRYRYVGVVAAERWTYTIDRSDLSTMALWGHGDGAAAVIVGRDPAPGALGELRAASFVSRPEMNGFVRVRYGGTREPVAPPGCNPFQRTLRGDAGRDLFPKYLEAIGEAYEAVTGHVGLRPTRGVINQVSPNLVSAIEARCGLPEASVPRTGETLGHVGGADLALGIEALAARGQLTGPTALISSCPYAFAAGVLVPG